MSFETPFKASLGGAGKSSRPKDVSSSSTSWLSEEYGTAGHTGGFSGELW